MVPSNPEIVPSFLSRCSLSIAQLLPFLTGCWVPTIGQKTPPKFPYWEIVVRLESK